MRRLALVLAAAAIAPPAALAGPELTFSRPEAFGGGVFTAAAKRLVRSGSQAAWSPNGRQLAVVAGDGAALHVVDADGRNRVLLAFGPVSSPDWSPDGRSLVFERFGWLHRIDADGTDERRFARGRSPAWSPGGRRIAFVSDRGGSDDLYAVRATGGGLRQLTSGIGGETDPAWSPNGRKLAYVTDESRGSRGRPGRRRQPQGRAADAATARSPPAPAGRPTGAGSPTSAARPAPRTSGRSRRRAARPDGSRSVPPSARAGARSRTSSSSSPTSTSSRPPTSTSAASTAATGSGSPRRPTTSASGR